MSNDDLITYDLGPQNDGEPAVVVPAEPVVSAVEEEPATASGEETPAEVEEETPRKKPGSQRERERRIAAEAQLELLKAQLAGKQPEAPKPEGKPTADQFTSHEEWIEALTDWKTDQKIQTREAEKAKTEAMTAWEAKKEAARDKYEDFDDALDGANASPVVLQKMLKSPVGADIGYFLATNPKELKKINAMDPEDAYDALKVIEKRFTGTQEPVKPPVKTPKPPSPVVAASVTRSGDGRIEVY